jgi:tetratricopeptide (TPR) repeat protein
VAILQCNVGRASECAEFANKASIHAAALSAGKIKSRMLSSSGAAQAEALLLQGKAQEAEALAAQLLVEPHCCEDWLHASRSRALRLEGRFDEALEAAEKAVSIGSRRVPLSHLLAERGMAELESKNPAKALASLEEAMRSAPPPDARTFASSWPLVSLAYGRVLLANHRPAEAVEALRQSYGLWLGQDAKSVWAAEAEYWFAQAYIANGDVKRGRWMLTEAKRALATSPYQAHRALAQRAVP